MLFDTFYGIMIIEWIILIILFFILIFYFVVQNTAPDLKNYVENNKNLKFIDVDYLMENADNGDLVFMSGDTRGERSCRYFTKSMYSHVGMLFRENHPETGENILYIWDSDLGQKTKDGPRIMIFKDKLKRYHGYPYLMWRKLKINDVPGSENTSIPSTENILEVVEKYKDCEFDNNMLSWWACNSCFYNLVKNDKKIFCSELIALTMQDNNINMLRTVDNGGKIAAWYTPGIFSKDNIFGLRGNYSYSDPKYVKFKK